MRIFLNKVNFLTRWVPAAFLFLFVSFQSQGQVGLVQDPNAQIWLSKMSEAVQSLNYRMSFVLSKPGGDPQPYTWRHAVDAQGTQMEQLDQLNGPGREVIRIGDRVSYFDSHRPPYGLMAGYISGPLPHVLLTDPISLMAAYEFVVVGKSRVSGRAAQQIRMVSKDKTRFGYSLWLDQSTGLPLKIDIVDLNGQKIEQIQVTGIEVTEQPDPFFSENIDLGALPDVIQLPVSVESKQSWKLGFVPVGMQQIKHSVLKMQDNAGSLEHIMVSDGLVDVSVYIQPSIGSSSENDIVAKFGSDIYYSRTQGQMLITVIGKIPANTANAIATSISRTN
ncbi:MucB/RseB C-terminal domain-containing protein [Aliiglaciecola sp.]|nr:MucB/RseB C-terminal domain-containing protein [Aliiglaciecola sp.]